MAVAALRQEKRSERLPEMRELVPELRLFRQVRTRVGKDLGRQDAGAEERRTAQKKGDSEKLHSSCFFRSLISKRAKAEGHAKTEPENAVAGVDAGSLTADKSIISPAGRLSVRHRTLWRA
jgi:hypothetical protein